jgi:hypothetical protein
MYIPRIFTYQLNETDMTTAVKFSDLYTTDEFIAYYTGASRGELRNRIKTLKLRKRSDATRNEINAIESLLA